VEFCVFLSSDRSYLEKTLLRKSVVFLGITKVTSKIRCCRKLRVDNVTLVRTAHVARDARPMFRFYNTKINVVCESGTTFSTNNLSYCISVPLLYRIITLEDRYALNCYARFGKDFPWVFFKFFPPKHFKATSGNMTIYLI
jgi:hypothetical protein